MSNLSRWANYVDTNNNGIFPPATAAKAVLFSIDDDDGIRPLERVVNIPTLRRDGTLLDVPGYDKVSRLFYHPTGIIPPIPEHPTQKDAEKAAEWILDMLCDFPFDDSSLVNYLGLLLTFPIRPLCGCVPMCLLDAPIAGSGKSLLAKIACISATGKAAAFGTQLGSEEETRKNITSRLRDGPSIIVMDNIEDAISSPILAMCLIAETWEDRLLGKSMLLALPVRAVFIATGNNLRTGKDMPRRCFYVKAGVSTSKLMPMRRNLGCGAASNIRSQTMRCFMSVDVQHALHVAEVMEDNGVSCRAVYGDMDIDERRETLEAFAAGEIRALTNCQLLTEGWDSPDLGAVLMARPTKSKVLYIQCVGRAYGRRRARRTVCSSILWTSRISMTSVPLEPWRETPASSRARGKLFFRLQMSGVGTVAEQNERGQKIFVH